MSGWGMGETNRGFIPGLMANAILEIMGCRNETFEVGGEKKTAHQARTQRLGQLNREEYGAKLASCLL